MNIILTALLIIVGIHTSGCKKSSSPSNEKRHKPSINLDLQSDRLNDDLDQEINTHQVSHNTIRDFMMTEISLDSQSVISFESPILKVEMDLLSNQLMKQFCNEQVWDKFNNFRVDTGADILNEHGFELIDDESEGRQRAYLLKSLEDQREVYLSIKGVSSVFITEDNRMLSSWEWNFAKGKECAFSVVKTNKFDHNNRLVEESYVNGDGEVFDFEANPIPKNLSASGIDATDIKLAIIDDGIDYNNSSFSENFRGGTFGWDYVDGDQLPYNGKSSSHGNQVALAATEVRSDIQLIVIREVIHGSTCFENNIIRSILKAEELGAKVVNMSFSGVSISGRRYCGNRMENLRLLIEEKSHLLFVATAGNEGQNLQIEETAREPAWFDIQNLIVVGAVDSQGNLTDYSNFGVSRVHLGAKGDISFPRYNGSVGKTRGTSFAAPRVAAVGASLMSICTAMSPKQVKKVLLNTVEKNSSLEDAFSTSGILDSLKARRLAEYNCEQKGP